jgi:uncharacterized protein YjbI with pentapeptide repeats
VRETLLVAEFDKEDLSRAKFDEVDFTHGRMRNVYFVDAFIRGAWLENVDNRRRNLPPEVNGVDVGPLVEAELDRRAPRRAKMRPTTAAGFREAWPVAEEIWVKSVERARRLPP